MEGPQHRIFSKVWRESWTAKDLFCAPSWPIGVCAPELLWAVGQYAGLPAAHILQAVSRRFHQGLAISFSELVKKLTPKVLVVGGNDVHGPTAVVEVYSPFSGTWSSLSAMPTPRSGCKSAAVAGSLYIVGGSDTSRFPLVPLDTVESFDPSAGAWTKLPAAPSCRADSGVVALGTDLYVLGSWLEDPIECFNVSLGRWLRPLPAMSVYSTDRQDYAAALFDLGVYIFGGMELSSCASNLAECWDLIGHVGIPLPPMPTPRWGCSAVSLGSLIYVLGGSDGHKPLAVVEAFDPKKCLWAACPSMPTPRTGCSLAVAGGRLHAMGGRLDERALDVVEAFDPRTGEWQTCSPMPTARFRSTACALQL